VLFGAFEHNNLFLLVSEIHSKLQIEGKVVGFGNPLFGKFATFFQNNVANFNGIVVFVASI